MRGEPMATEKLEKARWHRYFDAMSEVLSQKEAQVDARACRFDPQLGADYTPLLGIVYDDRNDILEVLFDGLDYAISNVREIVVDHEDANLNSVSVTDAAGVQQIIHLRDLVMPLPAFSLGMETRP